MYLQMVDAQKVKLAMELAVVRKKSEKAELKVVSKSKSTVIHSSWQCIASNYKF